MSKYFDELLKEYHVVRQENKNKDKLIALTLALAQYYYQHHEMEKAKHHLHEVQHLNSKVENVHTYFSLIALYEGNNSLALKEINSELKLFPENRFAQNLHEKIHVGTTLPFMTASLILIFTLIAFLFNFQLSLTQLYSYGLSNSTMSFVQTLSSIFIHIDLIHLLSNIAVLLLFGHLVEKYIGHTKFITIFFLSAIVGNFSQIYFTLDTSFVVGASAGIFGLLGALLMRAPLLSTRLFGLINVPLILVMGVIFSLSLLLPANFLQSAEVAHILGFFTGILCAISFYPKHLEIFYNWIFIAFGFLLFILGFESLLSNPFNFVDSFINILIIIIGLVMLLFSYSTLTKYFMVRGDYYE